MYIGPVLVYKLNQKLTYKIFQITEIKLEFLGPYTDLPSPPNTNGPNNLVTLSRLTPPQLANAPPEGGQRQSSPTQASL